MDGHRVRQISLAEASRQSGKLMSRGCSDELDASAAPTMRELTECLYFSIGDGRIWLNDRRMLLFDVANLGMIRREELDYVDPRFGKPWCDTIVYSIDRDQWEKAQ